MSNTPVNTRAESAQGKPHGRQGAWQLMREMKVFTLPQLRQRMPPMSRDTLPNFVSALCRGGFVARRGMVKDACALSGKTRQYELLKDTGVEAPRLKDDGTALPPTGQQNMWLALKILGTVTPAELAAHAATEETAVTERTAATYLHHLHTAGYLNVSSRGGEARYRLIRDTGGFAPMIQRTKVVFDPNLQRVMWHEDMEP